MALIFLGESMCPICGNVLMPEEEVKGLPAISNTSHPLYEYFDRGFHLQCFNSWKKKEYVLNILKDERRKFTNSESFKEMVSKHGKPNWLKDD